MEGETMDNTFKKISAIALATMLAGCGATTLADEAGDVVQRYSVLVEEANLGVSSTAKRNMAELEAYIKEECATDTPSPNFQAADAAQNAMEWLKGYLDVLDGKKLTGHFLVIDMMKEVSLQPEAINLGLSRLVEETQSKVTRLGWFTMEILLVINSYNHECPTIQEI